MIGIEPEAPLVRGAWVAVGSVEFVSTSGGSMDGVGVGWRGGVGWGVDVGWAVGVEVGRGVGFGLGFGVAITTVTGAGVGVATTTTTPGSPQAARKSAIAASAAVRGIRIFTNV